MNLSDYIRELGHEQFASKVGVSVWTAKAYRFGDRRPSPDVAARIIATSDGLVSWDDIYPPKAAA